jgi:predicted esterase
VFKTGFIACAALLLLSACSNTEDNDPGYAALPEEYAVGEVSITLVDMSRSTAAHGPVPEAPSRTLKTDIVYPAEGAPGDAVTAQAPAYPSMTPYPLVVLSHGLGGSVQHLMPLAQVWAARGYIVALPQFPLTNFSTPGGPVAQDVQNQPADVSFVIDQILAMSETPGSLLHNAVDGEKIAVGGHSNGGITTYGLVANSCCRDPRIDAALVLSGTTSPFADGEYNLSETPPILLVHGVYDDLILYNSAVRTYNALLPPKGLLTLEESDHGSYFSPQHPAFDTVAIATTDFFDATLRDDSAAMARLPEDQAAGVATMHWASDEASNIPVELLPEPETNRQAFLSATDNLVDGQVITVTWSGFLPGKVVNIMQCTGDVTGGAAACNISGGTLFLQNPTGMGSHEQVIRTGPIGNGVCDSANPCTVIVNDAGLTEEEAIVRIPITFAN